MAEPTGFWGGVAKQVVAFVISIFLFIGVGVAVAMFARSDMPRGIPAGGFGVVIDKIEKPKRSIYNPQLKRVDGELTIRYRRALTNPEYVAVVIDTLGTEWNVFINAIEWHSVGLLDTLYFELND